LTQEETWGLVPPIATRRILAGAVNDRSTVDFLVNGDTISCSFLPGDIQKCLFLDAHLGVDAHKLPEPGSEIHLQWLRKQDGYHYRFKSIFMGVVLHGDGSQAISAQSPKTMWRTQRRHAYRVPVPLDDAQNLTLHWRHDAGEFHTSAFAHDLSTDGVRLSFVRRLDDLDSIPKAQDTVEISISMHHQSYTVSAQITRISRIGTANEHASGKERFSAGVHFEKPFAVFQKALENYVSIQHRRTIQEGGR
jgi:c-di-GMP-binding flagellar brake protein YcgR